MKILANHRQGSQKNTVYIAYSVDELNLAEGLWWFLYGALIAWAVLL